MTQSIQAILEKQHLRWNLQKETVKNVYNRRHLPKPVITISRLIGSGASEIAKSLTSELGCELLGFRIMDEVATRSRITKELVDVMDERVHSQLGEWMRSMLRNRSTIDSDLHHRHLLRAINYFMETGNVVLLGRGAGFLPKTCPRLDIRIVAPMRFREKRVMARNSCTHKEAMKIISESDVQRAKFIHQLFGENWEDSRHYDIVINTGTIRPDDAVAVITTAWNDMARTHLEAGTDVSSLIPVP
ncbi:MAG: cytidylate kinase-like family protein [Deltaproteobacteria bacterium]|nr:cytidylate kinase-like family protein [Deltaproteobacteria bacterium]